MLLGEAGTGKSSAINILLDISDFAQTVLPLVLSKGQDNPPITLFMTGGKNLHFKNH